MLVALLGGMLAHGAALVGFDWAPLDRGDLLWVESGQTSGTLVGEDDGLLVGGLSAWGGPAGPKDAWLFGLSVARFTTVAWTADSQATDHVGALRPSLDYRRYLRPREPGQPVPYGQLGAYGIVPSAWNTSTAYTEAEQSAMDAASAEERARIGVVGGRLGAGVELWWPAGFSLGGRYDLIVQHTAEESEVLYAVSTSLLSEVLLTVGFVL